MMDWSLWPQFTVAGLFLLSLGIGIEQSGKPKSGNHNFGVDFTSVLLMAWLLYMGGFWT